MKPRLAHRLPLFPRRMHTLGQLDIHLDGDEATVAAYFHNPMGMPQDEGTDHLVEFGGIYHHEFVRTPAGWRSPPRLGRAPAGWRSRRLLEQLVWKRGM